MHKSVNSDFLIIDLRDKKEHDLSVNRIIKNSVNIQVYDLEENINKMNISKNTPIFLFCNNGTRSKVAYIILKELGYINVTDVGTVENICNMFY